MVAVPRSLWTLQGILPASLAYGVCWGSSDGSSSVVTWPSSLCVLFLCVCLSSLLTRTPVIGFGAHPNLE